MDKVALVADLFDDLAMKIYEVNKEADNKITYLEALTFALNLLNGTIDRIDEGYIPFVKKITAIKITSEELRRALFLDEVKAFKDLGLNLDEITPDAIGLIISQIIPKHDKMTILDLGLGSGNLSSAIATAVNHEINFIGIEQNNLLCSYLEAYFNLAQIKMEIHMEDMLSYAYPNVDLIVGDLYNYQYENEYYDSPLYKNGVRDFVYLVIEKHLNSGNKNTLAFYLVDADFFSLPNSTKFKECFIKEAYFKAIITLPQSFFKGKTKMIIVVAKKGDKEPSTDIYNLPSIEKKEQFINLLLDINKNLEK